VQLGYTVPLRLDVLGNTGKYIKNMQITYNLEKVKQCRMQQKTKKNYPDSVAKK